jgi:hypothetical protein
MRLREAGRAEVSRSLNCYRTASINDRRTSLLEGCPSGELVQVEGFPELGRETVYTTIKEWQEQITHSKRNVNL